MLPLSTLRILRVLAGKTQRDLAAEICRTPTWLSLVERGIETPTEADVQRLAVALRVQPALLMLDQAQPTMSRGRRHVSV